MLASRFAQALGTVLYTARRARGLSQQDLADMAQFDRTYPSLLERGQRDLKMVSFLRLCAALERAPQSLLSEALTLMEQSAHLRTSDRHERARSRSGDRVPAAPRAAPRPRRAAARAKVPNPLR